MTNSWIITPFSLLVESAILNDNLWWSPKHVTLSVSVCIGNMWHSWYDELIWDLVQLPLVWPELWNYTAYSWYKLSWRNSCNFSSKQTKASSWRPLKFNLVMSMSIIQIQSSLFCMNFTTYSHWIRVSVPYDLIWDITFLRPGMMIYHENLCGSQIFLR